MVSQARLISGMRPILQLHCRSEGCGQGKGKCAAIYHITVMGFRGSESFS